MIQGEAFQGSAHFKLRHFRRQQPLTEHPNISVNWEAYCLRILNGLQELNSLFTSNLGGLIPFHFCNRIIPLSVKKKKKKSASTHTQSTKQIPQTLSHHVRSLTQSPLLPGSDVPTTEQELWAHSHPCSGHSSSPGSGKPCLARDTHWGPSPAVMGSWAG